MASDDIRKKWGTIFMGDRESSVEQLNAMQESMRREKLQKEQGDDYMERVRARAADRAREILGAAYTERQKVLDETRAEAREMKRQATNECARLKEEGEAFRKLAQTELDNAANERKEAENICANAHEEGFKAGMEQAAAELNEFRAELGQSVSGVLHAIERQRQAILLAWRDELAVLVQAATQAATGFMLQKEHQAILRAMLFQALDLLEERSMVAVRVNPADEATVNDMFKAARERFPELRQWIVDGDERIEKGGLVAESGSGRVDLQRENFRGMVEGILSHLALPELESESGATSEMRDLVEREVARIASLTPEPDQPAPPEQAQSSPDVPETPMPEAAGTEPEPEESEQPEEAPAAEPAEPVADMAPEADVEEDLFEPATAPTGNLPVPEEEAGDNPSIAELEEELFPLDEENPGQPKTGAPPADADPRTLSEGGFL